MTKKVLIKWLEGLKEKALAEIGRKQTDALDAYYKALYEEVGLAELAKQVQTRLEEVDILIAKWHDKYETLIGAARCYYGNIHDTVYPFISGPDATYSRLKDYEVDKNAKGAMKIRSQYKALQTETQKAYDGVILNVQSLKDAKLGMEYLKGLGFDLTELLAKDSAPVETALSATTDTRYLFLGGAKNAD